MKIKKEELLHVLNLVKMGIPRDNYSQFPPNFIFSKESIFTYRENIFVSYPFHTDISCSVIAEDLQKIINNMNRVEIEIFVEKNKLKISSENVKSSLSISKGITPSDIIAIEKAKKNKIKLPEDFIEAISLCMFSASKDFNQIELSCIYINKNVIAATDGYRISEFQMSSDFQYSDAILLPSNFASLLTKFEKVTYFAKVDNWIFFFSDNGAYFCCTAMSGEYPEYVDIMNEGFYEGEIIFPSDAKKTILAASTLTEGDFLNRQINVEIQKNKFSCKGENSNGWVESENKISYKGKKISFCINPDFFCDILNNTNKMFFGENKLLFQNKKFNHVISLFNNEEE